MKKKSENDFTPPLVSVYITNRNYGKYLAQAIQSVLNQTMRNFELLIIDDGSTDHSREIIEKYNEDQQVISIFQNKKGLTVSNNIALRASHGQFIMRLDADDFLDPNALYVLSDSLNQNPSVDMIVPDYFITDQEGNVLEVVRNCDFDQVSIPDRPAHGACTLIRKTCLVELKGYDESLTCQDGFDLWLRFINRFKVQNINIPLFYYRRHQNNLTNNEELILSTRAKILEKQSRRNGDQLRSVTAIIPVRGEPLDAACNPLRKINGKCLIDWCLEAVLQSRRISNVLISSPDEGLLHYVQKRYSESVVTVKRSHPLAKINTPIEQTLFHALDELERYHASPEAVALLYMESPFRSAEDIDAAVHVMELFDVDSVIGVRPEDDRFYQHNGHGLVPVCKNQVLRLERDALYRQVGQMQIVRKSFLEECGKLDRGTKGHVVMSELSSFRLRSELDWEVAKILAKKIQMKQNEVLN